MFKLAIVGRPNVGKSALFNRICKKRIAIVDQVEGTTRDRLYAQAELFGFPFEVIDTGGFDAHSFDPFKSGICSQAQKAISEADTLVMVVDGQTSITEADQRLVNKLLQTGQPLTLAINKIDDPSQEFLIHEFHKLGISNMIAVSALHGYQIAELLEKAWEGFSPREITPSHGAVKISVIGRPNVGKSTLINALLEKERCLVSPLAGTTRDSVDIAFSFNQQNYCLIDTAGIRRKKSQHTTVEKFATLRTDKTIERSDICLLMLDAREGMTRQEKRIAKQIEEAGKGCVVLMNKWDLLEGFRMEHCLQTFHKKNPFLAHCPLLFISAKTGRNLNKIFIEVDKVHRDSQTRITTHALNQLIEHAIQLNHPPMLTGKRLRIYYMTQINTQPPHFIAFVNRTDLMIESYKKYLIKQLRSHYPFTGNPLRFSLQGKKRESQKEG